MKRNLLLLVLVLQTAWVVGTVAVQESRLVEGELVLLETRPVDPRDLLRGDYVILNYDISSVPLDRFEPGAGNVAEGATIYVELRPQGEFHVIDRASTQPIEAAPGHVVLRGKARYLRAWQQGLPRSAVQVEYGLERYYVREGTGRPHGKITVQAAVAKSGRTLIKQVFVDGVPYAEAMKADRP